MASFDFGSGVRGAEAGASTGNPYAAIAGFVIGGFVGGHKRASEKKKLKKKQRRYAQQWEKMLSPAYGAQLQSQFLPQYRNTVAQGLGPMLSSDVSTRLSRHGLTGTGLGEAMYGLGSVAPDIAANQMAQTAANQLWQQKLDAFQQHALGENIGWMGQPIQKADPFGSAGAAVDLIGSYGGGGKNLFSGDFWKQLGGKSPQWQMPSYGVGQGSFQKAFGGYNFAGPPTQYYPTFQQQYSGPFTYQQPQRNPFYG